MLFIFISYLTLICIINANHYILIQMSLTGGTFDFLLFLGNPRKAFFTHIDTIASSSVVQPNSYNPDDSFTSFKHHDNFTEDIVILSNYSGSKSMTIPFAFNYSSNSMNSIAMGYNIINQSHSLLYSLYKLNYITSLSFSFIHYKEFSYLCLGSFPSIMEGVSPCKSQCNVNKHYNHWGCDVSQFGTYSIQYKDVQNGYGVINSNEYEVSVPLDVIYEIKEMYFDNLISDGTCEFDINNKHSVFTCDCSIRYKFPNIDIILDNKVNITLSGYSLFTSERKYSLCEFIINPTKPSEYYDNKYIWVLGLKILNKYSIEFDYNNSTITFHSNSPFIYVQLPFIPENDLNNIKLNMINATSFILILFTIFISLYKYITP